MRVLPTIRAFSPVPLQADYYNHLIRRIVVSSGLVSALAGNTGGGSANGLGTTALFNLPHGIAMDPAGTIAVVVSGTLAGGGRNHVSLAHFRSNNLFRSCFSALITLPHCRGTGTTTSYAALSSPRV